MVSKKLQLGIAIFCLFLYELNSEESTHMAPERTERKIIEEKQPETLLEHEETHNQRINMLKIKADTIRTSALELGGLSEPKIFNYEGDWCVFNQDLSIEDQIYAQSQREDWYKKQSHAERISIGHRNIGEDMLNYLDMDLETLEQYAQQDDVVALRMLAEQVQAQTELPAVYKAAERLAVLGDWETAIPTLVIRKLMEADYIADSEPQKAKRLVIQALAYAEVGFQHAQSGSIYAILNILKSRHVLLPFVRDVEAQEVSEHVEKISHKIAKERRAQGIDLAAIPRIALYDFQTSIAMMYDRGEDIESVALMEDNTLFPEHWKSQYLNTPCIKRRIATREANFHLIPAIQREISSLQKQTSSMP
ncbi:hypothetical protein [Pseudoalteromonas sp. MMG005]|uniref:hypothetical protein n=1 Tax=Pseudoalteromonas sp. MMG005 TaxID=2822682 RepID=UPI001B39DBD8|nr:hypothetical protein [Pseudoalteromonas sp. MMG005]MBQ4844770.1 hypothetical protein [Pseudoalteromonas sp. MMG005]